MAWAQEMKNLAAEIKTSHIDRTTRIKEIKGETRDILVEADAFIKKTAVELKDMAKDLKDFLAKSEEKRMADFKGLMKDVTGKVEEIKKSIKDLLGDYRAERKDAAGYWDRLRGKEVALEEASAAEGAPAAPKKRGRKGK